MLKMYNPFAIRLAWETRDCKTYLWIINRCIIIYILKSIRTFVFPSTSRIAIYAFASGSSLKYAWKWSTAFQSLLLVSCLDWLKGIKYPFVQLDFTLFTLLVVTLSNNFQLFFQVILLEDGDISLAKFLKMKNRKSFLIGGELARTTLNNFKPLSLNFASDCSRTSSFACRDWAKRPMSWASWPVTATIRRMPFAIPISSVMTKSLMSPVFATCLRVT